VARVEALLAGAPDGEEAARRFGRWAVVLLTMAMAAAGVSADPLHHGFETLLGWL
jgi:hypothetical protein